MARQKQSTKRSSRKKDDLVDKKFDEDLSRLDAAAKKIFSAIDSGYQNRQILNSKDQKFRSILDRELDISKGVSQGSIIDFVSTVAKDKKSQKTDSQNGGLSPDTNDLFTKNINDIFGYFQDLYRNRYLEMSDLKFVSKFIPALGEAVKTILDSIVASDSMSETINFAFDLPSSISNEDKEAILNEIYRNEKELKLRPKIKNVVIKNSLITSQFYVYAVSYNRVFEEYDIIKKKEKGKQNPDKSSQFSSTRPIEKDTAKESYIIGDIDISPAMESVREILSEAETDTHSKLSQSQISNIIESTMDYMPTIHCDESNIYEEALESASFLYENQAAFEAFKRKKNAKDSDIYKEEKEKHKPLEMKFPDGTIGAKEKKIRPSKFNVSGTYIKYIPAKNLVPLKVFDQVIGYYLIHPKAKKNKNSAGLTSGINSIGTTLFSTVNVSERKKQDAIDKIVNSISEGILKNFDNKFIKKNSEYKKLIADCIIANGLTDKDYNIQFIPADDIIPFIIQENEEGYGESVLADSLFPAKAALSLIVCRMLNYVNKTGNKTIAHIYKGPVNPMTNNHINRVIRDLQEQNVTFNDLLSPNLVFNKFNRDGNIALPTARNGSHLVDFETQEGQNIDMNPEYEKQLIDQAILGTGVPTVIMEYAGAADYAKQIISAHIKYAGRIVSLQSDLEDPTTLLYKKICENSNLSDDQKTICAQSLTVKYPRPKVVTNANEGEFLRNIIDNADMIADLFIGKESGANPETNPNGAIIKDKLVLEYAKKNAPFIDWEELLELFELVNAQYAQKPSNTQNQGTDSMSGGEF